MNVDVLLVVVEVGIEIETVVLVDVQVQLQNWGNLNSHFHCDVFQAK